jgi:hypothetical protein
VRCILAVIRLILAVAVVAAAVTVGLVFRPGACTLTGTTSAGEGGDARTVSVCARYSVSWSGQVRIRSVRASLSAAAGYWAPRFIVVLTHGAGIVLDDRLASPAHGASLIPFYSSHFTAFRGPGADGSFGLGETMVVRLTVQVYGPDHPYRVALGSVPLVLNRPGSLWPNPGVAGAGDFSGSWVDWITRPPRRRLRAA